MVVVAWVAGVLAAAGGATAIGRRALERKATAALERGLADLEQRITDEVGGTAHVEVDGHPVQVLMALRDERIPAARLVIERATLPNGLAVRRAELTSRAGVEVADLVARITPRAISQQLDVPGTSVRVSRGRLRLMVGVASVGLDVSVEAGRVVLGIPVAPPPIGTMLSAGLTELVPRPPELIELHDVSVVDDELEVRAIVALGPLVERMRADD